MAYGLDFVIPFEGDPDPTLPYADPKDAMLNPGSLFLIEPNHSADPLNGVPAVGGLIPNIAWQTAAAMLGGGTHDSLAFRREYTADAGGKLKTERTPRGGLHVIISQSPTEASGFGIQASGDLGIAASYARYLYDNRAHQFYYSRWERITRGCPANQGEPAAAFIGQSTGPFEFFETLSGSFRAETSPKNFSTGARSVTGLRFGAALFTGFNGSGAPAFNLVMPFGTGVIGPWFDAPQYDGKGASAVFYRSYLEDLTVSGRSYEDALAADRQLYADAFAPGGRYYNDTTPTNPATIP